MAFLLVSNNEMPLVRHRFTAAVPCLALDSVDRLGRNDSLRRATSKNSTDSECDIVIGEYMADSYDWVQADVLLYALEYTLRALVERFNALLTEKCAVVCS